MTETGESRCPVCKGRGTCVVHIDYTDRRSEWRREPCSTCGGTGRITGEQAARIRAGEALRADRIARGQSLRAEAERLGITAQELSAREHGRTG